MNSQTAIFHSALWYFKFLVNAYARLSYNFRVSSPGQIQLPELFSFFWESLRWLSAVIRFFEYGLSAHLLIQLFSSLHCPTLASRSLFHSKLFSFFLCTWVSLETSTNRAICRRLILSSFQWSSSSDANFHAQCQELHLIWKSRFFISQMSGLYAFPG